MPRTSAYVSTFDSLIKKPADRRSVITAAGVTAMLALPPAAALGATAGGASTSDDDWPGFREWVAEAVAVDETYEHGRLHWHEWKKEQMTAHEDALDDRALQVWQKAEEMARLIERVVDNSPKRLAMLITFSIWGVEKGSHNSFDFASISERHRLWRQDA